MGISSCWVWDSLPCAAWCLLCCHWPDMISSIYPQYCWMREAFFLHHYYACAVPQSSLYDMPPNGEDKFIQSQGLFCYKGSFLVIVCRNVCILADKETARGTNFMFIHAFTISTLYYMLSTLFYVNFSFYGLNSNKGYKSVRKPSHLPISLPTK